MTPVARIHSNAEIPSRIWEQITDPRRSQRKLFRDSIPVYEALFSDEHLQPWQELEQYILDTQKRKRRNPDTEPLDFYFVGTLNGKVRGMAFLTTYPSEEIAFLSYFGVLEPFSKESKELAFKGFLKIREAVRRAAGVILFEVEKVPPAGLSDPDPWVRERVEVLRNFQRFNARKISWLLYLQAKFKLGSRAPEAENLHLMVLHTSRLSAVPSSASREQVLDWLRFIYKRFDFDGYIQIHPKRRREAKRYTDQLYARVVKSLPPGAKEIPLGLVALRPWDVPTFISYAVRGSGSNLARLLASYLEEMGIPVVYWKKDSPREAGTSLRLAIQEWVTRSTVVLGILTPEAAASWGVANELAYAAQQGKRIIALLREDISHAKRRELESKLSSTVGNVIYLPFREDEFHVTMANVEQWYLEHYGDRLPGRRAARSLRATGGSRHRWDFFIAHASEDKQAIARPLAAALAQCGFRVWLDELQLRIGDSLRRKIDEGLANSRYGVVILSPHFFAKEWPQRELDALVSREEVQVDTILPVWHGVSKVDVARFSPILASRLSVSSDLGMVKVLEAILRATLREEHQIKARMARYTHWDVTYTHGVAAALQWGEFQEDDECANCGSKGLYQVISEETTDWYVGDVRFSYCRKCDYLRAEYLDTGDSIAGHRPPGLVMNPSVYDPGSFGV